MDQRLGRSMSRTRVSMMLATVLAGISLSLALVGLYGVLSFGVAQRRREFAVRMALGASPAGVRRLVLRDGLLLTGVGAVLGALGAIAVAGLIRGLLFGTGLTDLRQYVYGVALVLTCSVAAFWLPARRASATHPMTTLRAD
jgi:ABC-type antimicrobial peptide transport system permease subunit